MKAEPERQIIADFVTADPTNLGIALRVSHIIPGLQREIIQQTLDELEKLLRSRLDVEWEIWNNREEVLVKRYSGFSVRRPGWGDVYILLEFRVAEQDTIVGIWRDRERPKMATLDDALDKVFSKDPGDRNRWWSWFAPLDTEFGRWNEPQGLVAMQFRRKEVAAYFSTQILDIHRKAASAIDSLLKTQ
jgi:hypothetical protein